MQGISASPDFDGGAVASLAGDDLETGPARSHEDRLEDALLAHGRDQLRQIAHVLPRLLRVRLDVFDRHHAPDRLSPRTSELIDEVHVVSHAQGFRQADASWARHVR